MSCTNPHCEFPYSPWCSSCRDLLLQSSPPLLLSHYGYLCKSPVHTFTLLFRLSSFPSHFHSSVHTGTLVVTLSHPVTFFTPLFTLSPLNSHHYPSDNSVSLIFTLWSFCSPFHTPLIMSPSCWFCHPHVIPVYSVFSPSTPNAHFISWLDSLCTWHCTVHLYTVYCVLKTSPDSECTAPSISFAAYTPRRGTF